MPNDLDVGIGVLHLDVLRARLRRQRRRLKSMAALLVLLLLLAALWPLVQMEWRGQGTLIIASLPAQASVTLDGQLVTNTVSHPLSGEHVLRVTQPGAYPLESIVGITRAQTTTVTLPALRPRPAVQPIPLPAPGAHWQVAYPDPAAGWRLSATAAQIQPTPQMGMYGSADIAPPAPMHLRLDTLGLARLSALEAYAAADELIIPAGRFWAAWEPSRTDLRGIGGHITLSTPTGGTVITSTRSITGLWWAPAGKAVLIAEQHGIGQDVFLWSATAPTAALGMPIVTVPGRVAAVNWQPDGRAAVVLSTQGSTHDRIAGQNESSKAAPERAVWDATLIVMTSPAAPRALRLAAPPAAPLGLLPMAWSADALLWTAESGQSLMLQRIPLSAALPTQLGTLPRGAVALTMMGDDQLRVLVNDGHGALKMQAWPSGETQFILDEAPATAQMGGIWNGNVLLLASGSTDLWALSFAPETLR